MASKVFLDANVLLDLTLKRAGFANAGEILEAAIHRRIDVYTTPAVLHIVSYFTSQHFSSRQTKDIILTILNDVQVIDCDHATAVAALSSGIDDAEDALQYYTAMKHDLDCFVSSDKKLRKLALPQLPVYTAAQLVAELGKG